MNNFRMKAVRKRLEFPLVIKKKENLFYLTGQNFDLRAEEYLLLSPFGAGEVVGFGSGLEHIDWIQKSDTLRNIAKYIRARRLDIEWGFTYGEGEYIQSKLKAGGRKTKVVPARSPVDTMRQVKEISEIRYIRKSMEIVERVFARVQTELRKKRKLTEAGLAQFIHATGRHFGAEDVSFPAIVASGANAAIPHHVPGKKTLRPGESIILDFGFKYKNYCSDFTRTVFIQHAPKKLADAYGQVERAYTESIRFIDWREDGLLPKKKPSFLTGGAVHQKAADILKEGGLDKYFIHSLGHGTGLEIHELPNVSPKSRDILQDGMVFSIEPGVYFSGIGGIRIEDLVYLENGKIKKFIQVPTGLEANIIR